MTGLYGKNNGFLPQFLAVLSATLNAVSDGMNYAWSSPILPRLKQKNSPIEITETDETWLEISLLIAGLIGLPLTTYLVDKIGRKQSTLAASCTCVIGWTMIAFADHVVYLYIARFMMGVAADISFISSPMYIAEISHKSFRGFLAGIVYTMSMTGTLIMYAIGPYVDFYVPSIVAGVFLITQISTLPFMPDSPYFLLVKGKFVEARNSLRRLRGKGDVEDELSEIQDNIEAERQKEKGKVSDLFTVPSIRKAVIIMAVLNGGQHLGGFTVITMNLHSILETANSEYLGENFAAVLFAGLMLIASLLALLVVDKFGRKTILILSTITTGITLVTIGLYFSLQVSQDVSSISWIPVVAVMIFAITFKLGLGIVPIVLTAELFPATVKAYGMASADAMYVIFGSLSIYIYQFLKDDAGGIYTPFYFFAGCCFLTGIFTFLFVPETKGRTLEEIQSIMRN
ncbi:hypothetical protein WA026_004075 [Henosepilachna vigintioctopunctata]|uniref:Major facilitator superfamily (MFS) profile domain-containing protein n=1 Tax=Henosepilachna vigintioctopunctata TaxID=420089 RepID=A0AAW1UF76_9CUCU